MVGNAFAVRDEWEARVWQARDRFEGRWTMLTLRRVDPEMAGRLDQQRALYREAILSGSVREVGLQGAAMCRGYAAATAALEAAETQDDAYQVGRCAKTNTVVVISDRKVVFERALERFGKDVVWLTADEIAALFGSVDALKLVAAVKRTMPESEITEVRRTAHVST